MNMNKILAGRKDAKKTSTEKHKNLVEKEVLWKLRLTKENSYSKMGGRFI